MAGLERLSIFIAVLVMMIAWELIAPRRHLHHSRFQRWTTNFSLSIVSMILMRFTIASLAIISASYAMSHNWGLLNLTDLPLGIHIVLGIVLLDLTIYWQHRASHQWKWLWRLHKVHHTDLDFDVSTAVRFHPVEILLSMCYKGICILIIGANPVSVIVFEIVLSSCALFNHSNVKLPLAVDKVLRVILVTPDMHRVHHSVIQTETDSNYSFSISLWDRLFSSYTEQPEQGHDNMTIGLSQYQHIQEVSVQRLLLMPFK